MRGSPFFDGVSQADADIAGQTVKMPIFYYEGGAIMALFPARYGELRKLLPDPRFVPARLAPGLGVVAINCLEYRDTDIGPYNELAVAVVLSEPAARPNLPGLSLAEALRRRQFHVFIQHLPVTTEVAFRGGVDFYNFPKFIAEIEFDDDGRRRRCRLAEGQEPILTLSGERRPTAAAGEAQYFINLWMDRQPQGTEFKVNRLEFAATLRPDTTTLELAERHPIAKELRRLLVSHRPLRYEYTPRFEAILYGPERLSMPLLERIAVASASAKQQTQTT
jgi:Acetoacetate decarboxylase (ADC)